ncbi:MAG: FtsX-like permease family protein [Chitinophagales bacterium]
MNTPFFIAKKIAKPSKKSFSSFIILIATIAVALSVTVMVISTSMVNGFTNEIAEKVYGFWGHIHINAFGSSGNPVDQYAVSLDDEVIKNIKEIDGVTSISPIAIKPAAILQSTGELEKTFLKGVGAEYNWYAFKKYLKQGALPNTSDSVVSRDLLISETTANRMNLEVGTTVNLYFIISDNPKPIARKFKVCGIYNSGLEEFDMLYTIGDIRVIQQLNKWTNKEAGSYEVIIKNTDQLDKFDALIYYNYLPGKVYSETIKSIRPNIFDWLKLQKMNGNIVLIIMLVVAILNMVIALLILILDRTYMIGTIKSMGGDNRFLQRVFLYWSSFIVIRGLIIGNVIGLGLCFIQLYFGVIKLPEDAYYVTTAPIKIDWLMIALINFGTIGCCLLFLIIPSLLIMRISPIKAIRFN